LSWEHRTQEGIENNSNWTIATKSKKHSDEGGKSGSGSGEKTHKKKI
jgi:hypothetical protein